MPRHGFTNISGLFKTWKIYVLKNLYNFFLEFWGKNFSFGKLETAVLTSPVHGGVDAPLPMSFSGMAAEPLGGSR